MSFANFDIEAQTGQNPKSESLSSISNISGCIANFANNLSKLEKLNKQIGTKRDNRNLRSQIEIDLDSQSKNLAHIKDLLFNLQISKNQQPEDYNNNSELKLAKIQKELNLLAQNFNQLKRDYNEKKNSIVINEMVKANENQVGLDENSSLLANDTLLQRQIQKTNNLNQYDVDYHASVVEQREQNINEIEQGVQEINTIFQDINTLVQDQGVQIDTIENNLTNLVNDTRNSNRELIRADRYQQKKRRCSCIILMVLSVICILILLAILS